MIRPSECNASVMITNHQSLARPFAFPSPPISDLNAGCRSEHPALVQKVPPDHRRSPEPGIEQFAPTSWCVPIQHRRQLVIDELNRSNFDRAFGRLFAVLSGQTVVFAGQPPDTRRAHRLASPGR